MFGFQFAFSSCHLSSITGNNYNNVGPGLCTWKSSVVGIGKNEIPGAAQELWQLKIEQFSSVIFRFITKHLDNPMALNSSKVSCTLFTFHVDLSGLGSNNFKNSSYKENSRFVRVSRLAFRFLWLFCNVTAKFYEQHQIYIPIKWWCLLERDCPLALCVCLVKIWKNFFEWIVVRLQYGQNLFKKRFRDLTS